MDRYYFGGSTIATAGYDAQCAILEIEFIMGGQVWQYNDVPEDVWYQFKKEEVPEHFFHKKIKGNYLECCLLYKGKHSDNFNDVPF